MGIKLLDKLKERAENAESILLEKEPKAKANKKFSIRAKL